MTQNRNESDVARLIQRIDSENQAARWALTAPSLGTARHRFITRRMERIGIAHQELMQIVGEDKAAQLLVDTLNKIGEGKEP
jgi:hypothetical protein